MVAQSRIDGVSSQEEFLGKLMLFRANGLCNSQVEAFHGIGTV
jgi:hypothetical protein